MGPRKPAPSRSVAGRVFVLRQVLVGATLVSAVACSVPFTVGDRHATYGLSEAQVKGLQFYNSSGFTLTRTTSDTQVTPGATVRIENGVRIEEIVFPARVPGVLLREATSSTTDLAPLCDGFEGFFAESCERELAELNQREEAFCVAFDPKMPTSCIWFSASTGIEAGSAEPTTSATVPSRYYLWWISGRNGEALAQYAGRVWTVEHDDFGDASPHLRITSKVLNNVETNRRVLEGMTVPTR